MSWSTLSKYRHHIKIASHCLLKSEMAHCDSSDQTIAPLFLVDLNLNHPLPLECHCFVEGHLQRHNFRGDLPLSAVSFKLLLTQILSLIPLKLFINHHFLQLLYQALEFYYVDFLREASWGYSQRYTFGFLKAETDGSFITLKSPFLPLQLLG